MLKSKFWKSKKNQNGKIKNEVLMNKQKQSTKFVLKEFKKSQKQEKNKILSLVKQKQIESQSKLHEQSINHINLNIYYSNKQKILLSLPTSLPINYFHQIIPSLIMLHKKHSLSSSQIYNGFQIKSILDSEKRQNLKHQRQNQNQIIDFCEYIKNIELKTQRDKRWDSCNKGIQKHKSQQQNLLIFNDVCYGLVKYLYQSVCIALDDAQIDQLSAFGKIYLFKNKQQENLINIQIKYKKIDQKNVLQTSTNKITSQVSSLKNSSKPYHKKSQLSKNSNKFPPSLSQQQQSLVYSQSFLISPSNFSQNKQLKSLFSNSNSRSKSKSSSIRNKNQLRSNNKYLELYLLDQKIYEMNEQNKKSEFRQRQLQRCNFEKHQEKHKQFYQSLINLLKNSTIIEWQVFYRMIIGFDQGMYQYQDQIKFKKIKLSKELDPLDKLMTIPLNIHDQSNKPLNTNPSAKHQQFSYDMIYLTTTKSIQNSDPTFNNQTKIKITNSSSNLVVQGIEQCLFLLFKNIQKILINHNHSHHNLHNNQYKNKQFSLFTHQLQKLYTYNYINSHRQSDKVIKINEQQQQTVIIKQTTIVVLKKLTKKGIRLDQYIKMIVDYKQSQNQNQYVNQQQSQGDIDYVYKLQVHLIDMVKIMLLLLNQFISQQTMQLYYHSKNNPYKQLNQQHEFSQPIYQNNKTPKIHHKKKFEKINLSKFLYLQSKLTINNDSKDKLFDEILSIFVIDLDNESKGEYEVKINAIRVIQLVKRLSQQKDMCDKFKIFAKEQSQSQNQQQNKPLSHFFIKISQQEQSQHRKNQQLSYRNKKAYKNQQNDDRTQLALDNKLKRKELFDEYKQNLLNEILSIVKKSSKLSRKQKQSLSIGIQHEIKSINYGKMFQYKRWGQKMPFKSVFVRYLIQKTKKFVNEKKQFKAESQQQYQKDDYQDCQQNLNEQFNKSYLQNRIKSMLYKQLQGKQACLKQLTNKLNYNFYNKTILSAKYYQTPRYFHFQADQNITLHEKQTTLKKNKKNSHSSNKNNQLDLIQQKGLKINQFCLNNQGNKGDFITLNPNKAKQNSNATKIREKKKLKRNKLHKNNKENLYKSIHNNKNSKKTKLKDRMF